MTQQLQVADGKRERRSEEVLKQYELHTDLPLMVLSIAVIPLVAVEWFGDLKPQAQDGVELTYVVIWAAFLADYVVRLLLSTHKAAYVRREWLALLLVILTAPRFFAFFSPFGFLRAARALRLLRLVRFGALGARGVRRIVQLPKSANSQLAVALGTFITVTLISAVFVLAVEAGQDGPSSIGTMGDALWWAGSTVSTVGYGDFVPRTAIGRLLSFIPMVAGVCLIGVVASNFGSRIYRNLEGRLGVTGRPLSDDETASGVSRSGWRNLRIASHTSK